MIYLALTLGRALPTLGEEYTDITPKVQRQARSSRAVGALFSSTCQCTDRTQRRYIAILLLVLPNILSPSVLLTWLKGDGRDDHMTPPPSGLKALTIRLLQSPFGQSLPELNTIAFLFGGRFLELGRRLTGLSYVSGFGLSWADIQVSTTPNRSHEKQSYQPLGILLCLPLVFRLLSWYRHRDVRAPTSITDLVPLQGDDDDGRPMPSSATDVSTLSDQPNTYLSPTAQDIAERQCTLCLEPRGSGEGSAGTVAVTECGHAFCWGCLGNLDKVSPRPAENVSL